MVMRRAAVLLIALATDVGLAWLLWRVLAPGGWTAAKLTMAVAFAGTAPWTGLCAANGIIGFVLSVLRPPFPATLPRGEADCWPLPRIAIAVTVRDEDMGRVLSALRRLLHGLDLAGAGDAFGVFILSDSQHGAVEERAVASFRADDRDPARIHYRRRLSNIGFKAGNIMDFLDHDAHGYELMLTLDADSEMSAAAVLRLIRLMQVEPTLAVAQHLTVGLPASSAFPRLFQFGMRAGMQNLGDRAGVVARRRRSLLGPQRGSAHRALSPPLPPADATERSAYSVARSSGSRTAERGWVGRTGDCG